MEFKSKNSFQSLDTLTVSGKKYNFFNLVKAEKNGLKNIKKLPKSIKVLLENLLRFEDDLTVNKKQIKAIADWLNTKSSKQEIAYRTSKNFITRLHWNTSCCRLSCNERCCKIKKQRSK